MEISLHFLFKKKRKQMYSQSKQTYSTFAEALRCICPFVTNTQSICCGAQHDEWTGLIFSICDYLEEMRSPLEMNKCGIYVSINI